jgi:alpha-glucoside transport system substrate-binding protein
MRHRLALLAPLAVALALGVAACGGDDEGSGTTGGTAATPTGGGDVSGTVALMGVWTGAEQERFQAVLDAFSEQYPNVTVNYTPAGDQLPTQLATAVEGGNPPDIASVAQPGLMADFARQDALVPLDFLESAVSENLGESAVAAGSVEGTLYGVLFKAANKSLIWYNVAAFEEAGVEPPETYDDLLAAADTVSQAGYPAYSIGGADGWTLTDLFENIYLRTAGPELYDQLSAHEIPWTHESVKEALTEMAKIVGDTENVLGGTSGALQTDFVTSVSNVFAETPKAAMVIEGDFVPGVVESPIEPETGYNVFEFPSVNDSPPVVVGGGDTVAMFKDTPAARALMEFLTTPEAAQAAAEFGPGYASLNQGLEVDVYPDAISQTTAGALLEAETFRFDLSDLQPAAFGGTVGQGMFKLFQDFLQNPDNVDQIAQQLERAAANAYGAG